MSYKQMLKIGLPVVVAIVLIITIALVAGREKPAPKISNHKELVIDFKSLKMTHGELYNILKTDETIGSTVLLELIDRTLLEKYGTEEYIDFEEIREAVEKEYKEDKDEFYATYAKLGIYKAEGEDDEDLINRVVEYKKLEKMKKAYARENHEVKDEDVEKEFENYREDVCIIPLAFETRQEVDNFYKELKDLNKKEDTLKTFRDKYIRQQEEKEDEEDTDEEDEYDYIDKDFQCEYVRLVYSEVKDTKYRDFVFDDVDVDSYNKDPYVADEVYYVIYKVAEAKVKGNPEKEKVLRERILENLIDKQVTTTFINRKIRELRKDSKLIIYDPILAEYYDDADVYKKANRKSNVVAEFNHHDEKVTITADDFYKALKERGAVTQVLNHINYAALYSIEELRLTKSEIKALKEEIKDLKASYLQSYYSQFLSWKEFIMTLGARNEEELLNLFALTDYLTERYILGYKDFAGANPITREDVEKEYKDWLEAGYQYIDASHILFKFDLDGDGEITDEEKERARKLAHQIYYGPGENDEYLIEEKDEDGWSNIYEIIEDDEDKDENGEDKEKQLFIGLYRTPVKDLEEVFSKLAREYSEDTSASNGGKLGNFGPTIFRTSNQQEQQVRMVKEFERAALATREKEFSEPFETEYGWHVIYVHRKVAAPVQPENYFDLTEEEIKELIDDGDKDLKTYHEFYQKLEKGLRLKRLSEKYVNYELAKLRDQLKFAFNDPILQANYEAMQKIYLTLDEEE